MNKEGVLYNPGLFQPGYLPSWHYAEEVYILYIFLMINKIH